MALSLEAHLGTFNSSSYILTIFASSTSEKAPQLLRSVLSTHNWCIGTYHISM